MIELYRREHDVDADRIEEALRDLSAAYRVHRVSPGEANVLLGRDIVLPALRDGGHVASGDAAICAFLDETARTLERWRKFQTDACYLDDDGEVC
jgi:hypothetical protein